MTQRPLPLTDDAREAAALRHLAGVLRRAMAHRYNLLRVSPRRWAVVRLRATTGDDVAVFEQVTKPLALGAAVEELERRRAL